MLQPTPITGILSAGAATASLGTVVFSNSNGVSFGINGQTVTASAVGGTGAGAVTFSAGASSASLASIVFSNSNGVSFGLNGSTMTGSINSTSGVGTGFTTTAQLGTAVVGTHDSAGLKLGVPAFITTARASSDAVGLNTAQTNVTWTVNSSGISINAGGYAGAGLTTTTTTGTVIVGTNNTAGLSLGVPAYVTAGGAGSAIKALGVSNTGNTSGNTGVSTGIDWVIAATNNITASQSTTAGGPNTIWLSGPTAGGIQAGSQTATSGTVVFSNSNGVTFGMSNSSVITASVVAGGTGGIYLTGNTTANSSSSTYNAGSLSISGAGAVSIGWNSASSMLVISGGTAAVGSLSFYASSNTTSTSSGSGAGSISIAGAGAISIAASNSGFIVSSPVTSSLSATGWASISTNGSTISIGASTTMNIYAIGNTTSTSSGTVDIRTLSISGVGMVSVGAANSCFIVSVPNNATANFYENLEFQAANSVTTTWGLSTLFAVPIEPQATLQWNQLNMVVSASLPTTSCANTVSVSFGTSGQSLQVDHFYSGTFSNFQDFYLLSKQAGGSSTDLATVSSTRNSVVTFVNETWRVNASAGAASQTATVSNSVSMGVSFPAITSATSTSVNAGTTVTIWGTGYSSWASTASGSTTTSKTTGATMSVSVGSTYPGTTAWSSYKLLQFNWGASTMPPGIFWVGMARGSSSSSSSSSASTSGAAGRSYTSSINMSDLTMTAQLSYVGQTNSILSSLGTFGTQSTASLAPGPGHGTYSATYAGTKTFMNNAGQANGEIALSDIATNVSFWKPWLQFASNRI